MQGLSFQPHFFLQVKSGPLAGNWVPVIPAACSARHTLEAYRDEAHRIVLEGGVVSYADGVADGALEAVERALSMLAPATAKPISKNG